MDTRNELAERYGPQTPQIEALLERARNLTDDETKALRDAWTARDADRDDAQEAAWDAWDAARAAARAAARDAAWDPAQDAAWTVRDAAWDAFWDATQALVVRDLVGQNGFTQEHYDTLVAPWESVMGTTCTRETL